MWLTRAQTLTAPALQSWQTLPQYDMVAGPKVLAAGPTADRFIREQTKRECLVIVWQHSPGSKKLETLYNKILRGD